MINFDCCPHMAELRAELATLRAENEALKVLLDDISFSASHRKIYYTPKQQAEPVVKI